MLGSVFSAGTPSGEGEKKGVPNLLTRDLKEMIREAMERVGSDGEGKDGGLGYLITLAKEEKQVFATLVRAILPTTINANVTVDKPYVTEEVALAVLKARGLPPDTVDRMRFIEIDPNESDPYDSPLIDVTPKKTPTSE